MLKTTGFPATRTGDQTIVDGSLVINTANKGINFTANTPAAGMTSQLLNWYEEGTWTPVDTSGAGLTLVIDHAIYTRVGRLVTLNAYIKFPITTTTQTAFVSLPFSDSGFNIGTAGSSNGAASYCLTNGGNASSFRNTSLAVLTNVMLSGADVLFNITYMV